MIRNVPTGASFTYRRRMGDAISISTQFNPITAGISAGVSLATTGLQIWMNSIQLSHDADTATTLIVNGLAQQLANLDAAYFAEQNVSCADQRAALDAYDSAWAWLQSPSACGNPSYGSAGNRCISDRATGGPFPWSQYYRDPIANDPRLAGQGCDTGQEVILPTIATGYANTGITSTGGNSTTGQTAAQIAAAAVAATSTTPTVSSVVATTSNLPLYIALGLGALLLAKS